jgi:outer membrane lipoprotein-sorting protein
MKRTTLTILLLLSALPLAASAGEGRVTKILNTIDEQYALKTDASAKVLVTQQKIDQGTKVIGMEYYRRDKNHNFMIIMTAPESDKGNGYLRVDDNFWMYRRNTRTFQHISRDESIGGTDAHGEDFEDRKMSELYQPLTDASGQELSSEEKLGQIPVYKFEIKAKVNDVDYPKKIYWVRKDNSLILKEESYSLSGTLMQTSYYLKYTQLDGRYIPVKMLFLDEFEKGNKSVVEISEISSKTLNDAIFTKAYLENLSK